MCASVPFYFYFVLCNSIYLVVFGHCHLSICNFAVKHGKLPEGRKCKFYSEQLGLAQRWPTFLGLLDL